MITSPRKSILVVDHSIHNIQEYLDQIEQHYSISFSSSFWDAREKINERPYDLVLSAFQLEDGHLFDLLHYCEGLRRRPVFVVMVANADKNVAISCLNQGVNGFIEIPFSAKDLIDLLNRKLVDQSESQSFKFYPTENTFQVNNQKYRLTDVEYKIMNYFVYYGGTSWISRESIIQEIWGEQQVSRNTLDTHITNLKAKINNLERSITNIRGKGFNFDVAKLVENQ